MEGAGPSEAAWNVYIPPVKDLACEGAHSTFAALAANEDVTTFNRLTYTKSHWQSLLDERDKVIQKIVAISRRPPSSWSRYPMNITTPSHVGKLRFETSTDSSGSGTYCLRMRAELPGWSPEDLINLVHDPRNICVYSILNWSTMILTVTPELRVVYNSVCGFDSPKEDVLSMATKFKHHDRYYSASFSFDHPGVPERPGYTRIQNMRSYFMAEKSPNGSVLHFGREDIGGEDHGEGAGGEGEGLFEALKPVAFYRFFLLYLRSIQSLDPVFQRYLILQNRHVLRHALRYHSLPSPEKLLYSGRRVHVLAGASESAIHVVGSMVISAPVATTMDAVVNRTGELFAHSNGVSLSKVMTADRNNFVTRMKLSSSFTGLRADVECDISMVYMHLNYNSHVLAFSSARKNTDAMPMQTCISPSSMIFQALSPNETFLSYRVNICIQGSQSEINQVSNVAETTAGIMNQMEAAIVKLYCHRGGPLAKLSLQEAKEVKRCAEEHLVFAEQCNKMAPDVCSSGFSVVLLNDMPNRKRKFSDDLDSSRSGKTDLDGSRSAKSVTMDG